jgi:hypothetical protein
MLRFDLSQPRAGWAQATIIQHNDELSVSASYTPIDTIRDFVDAVASLKTASSAHCCWFQEPGEMHWQFLRSGDSIVVEIIRFAGKHAPDGATLFRAETRWVDFAAQVVASMHKMRDSLGVDGYEREWRHPFPVEACEKLDKAVRKSEAQ